MTFAPRLLPAFACVLTLSACGGGLDLDLRGRLGGSIDTSQAASKATLSRPKPDDRGVLSYPSYQVAIAKRGDTVQEVAQRVGLPAAELARFNGIKLDDPLRQGEVIALPTRVSEPSPQSGAQDVDAIQAAPTVDVATLAAGAIDRAAPTAPVAQPKTGSAGVEPIRHKVARGETAFTIARTYDVSPRALAEWNGLDKAFRIREGQFLLIPPVALASGSSNKDDSVPGQGSLTPRPPSASKPLPVDDDAAPAAAAVAASTLDAAKPAAPKKPAKPVADIGQDQAKPAASAMAMPVQGAIIREYAKGRNEGIDISAAAGTPVKAAASGKVASVSTTAEGVKFLLIRHPGDLITVYTHIDDISVAKGDAISRGQSIGRVRAGSPAFLHFEVRKGFESTDPMPFLR